METIAEQIYVYGCMCVFLHVCALGLCTAYQSYTFLLAILAKTSQKISVIYFSATPLIGQQNDVKVNLFLYTIY